MTATTPGRQPLHASALPPVARAVQGRRAGAVTRTIANLVDAFVASLVVAVGYGVWCAVRFLFAPSKFTPPSVSFGVLVLAWLGALFLYFTAAWSTTGRTYGAHLLGLRVVGPRGRTLRLPGAILRAAFCVAFPIGLYWVLFSAENRSIQDVVLRTSVVYDWSNSVPPRDSATMDG